MFIPEFLDEEVATFTSRYKIISPNALYFCNSDTELVNFLSSEYFEQYGIICVLLCAFQFGPITAIDFITRY
jgi:hypothetical protein